MSGGRKDKAEGETRPCCHVAWLTTAKPLSTSRGEGACGVREAHGNPQSVRRLSGNRIRLQKVFFVAWVDFSIRPCQGNLGKCTQRFQTPGRLSVSSVSSTCPQNGPKKSCKFFMIPLLECVNDFHDAPYAVLCSMSGFVYSPSQWPRSPHQHFVQSRLAHVSVVMQPIRFAFRSMPVCFLGRIALRVAVRVARLFLIRFRYPLAYHGKSKRQNYHQDPNEMPT